jgi:hypothetical protein
LDLPTGGGILPQQDISQGPQAMTTIEFTQEVKFGDNVVDKITVAPLLFLDLCDIWKGLRQTGDKVRGELQRSRIMQQTSFFAAGAKVSPDALQLNKLPASVAKAIIDSLDLGSGPMGTVTTKGDGSTTPIIYKLGTPIEMKSGTETITISELEFMASTYGELEDVLAADTDSEKAKLLLSTIAIPVGTKLNRLPGFVLDRITTSDGIGVMNNVTTLF